MVTTVRWALVTSQHYVILSLVRMRTTGKLPARPTGVRWRFIWIGCLVCALAVCAAFGQRPFREYPGWEYYDFPKPPDWKTPGEWTFARLMYPEARFSDRP